MQGARERLSLNRRSEEGAVDLITVFALGFTGYVAHEYRPTPGRDPLKSLAQALAIMDV